MADTDDLDTRIAHAVAAAMRGVQFPTVTASVPPPPSVTYNAPAAPPGALAALPPGTRLAVMAEKQAQFGIVYVHVGWYPDAEQARRDIAILEARDGVPCHLVAFIPKRGGVVSVPATGPDDNPPPQLIAL
jgi:hypothetical protein